MKHKSSQVAIGGMASGLCLLLMFLTGMIPFSEYSDIVFRTQELSLSLFSMYNPKL